MVSPSCLLLGHVEHWRSTIFPLLFSGNFFLNYCFIHRAAEKAGDAGAPAAAGGVGAGAAGSVSFVRGETQSRAVEEERAANPDEIDIDEDSDEEGGDAAAAPEAAAAAAAAENGREKKKRETAGGLEKQAIPSQVFGGLKKDDDDD